mgnify:CR=1 FL=1
MKITVKLYAVLQIGRFAENDHYILRHRGAPVERDREGTIGVRRLR